MPGQIEAYFFERPKLIMGIGRMIVLLGYLIIFAGIVGRAGVNLLNIRSPQIGGQIATKTIADILPGLPLWWVPETVAGVVPALALVMIGICIRMHGKNIKRAGR